MQIEPYVPQHLDDVIRLSLRAWEPVFVSIYQTMGEDVYGTFYPDGWRISQEQAVTAVCVDDDVHVWVALDGDTAVGFVAIKLHTEDKMGEIYMVAVDPDVQGQGIGRALTDFAVAWMTEAGMAIAMVETGGDPGHAPARRTYEKAGFTLWPVARYFKKL